VPAVAGPFDVGTVVVQEALNLNPETAVAEVDGSASDPIPTILAGIPLRLRDLRVHVDRPGFTLNPTSCEPMATSATLWGSGANPLAAADNVPAALTSRYQAASCASLGFGPRLSLTLKGGTRRDTHAALRTVLTYPKGDGYANIGRAVVTLPPSQFIDNSRISNPCTREQFAAEACPPGSVLGKARATTPLLDDPLEGKIYFRSNGGARELPDVVADLRGQFRVILVGFVDSKNGRVRTTFASVPDAPVERFVLELKGGKKGLLVNSENLCSRPQRAKVVFTAQNGKRVVKKAQRIKTSCGKAKGKKRSR
jgi:hypothetical protein